MVFNIPGWETSLELKTVILDLNGTISIDGELVEGVHERIGRLKRTGLEVVMFTGNTRNDGEGLAKELGIDWYIAFTGDDKKQLALQMEPARCVAIGNGLIDLPLMETVALGIATLQAEGAHAKTLMAADVVVPSVLDALDLLLMPGRLMATLRK